MLRRLFLASLLVSLSLPLLAKPNRLASEKSRYLVEHSTNPVDWRPWGAEAFAEAAKAEKPVFVSIGYASCHWCHVMERESFTNDAIAAQLNAKFIPILVDREEHPEVDATYMTFLTAMTGSGGWPANFILTADRRPIVGGSYIKPEQLKQLLDTVATRWASDRASVLASSEQLMTMVAAMRAGAEAAAELPSTDVFNAAMNDLRESYDREHGGFGTAPKFPQPLFIDLLLRYSVKTKNDVGRDMALATLRKMAEGSIHDQIGGGFHRYTTDAEWRVPHFEKMLTDQALLAIAYTEAWQLTHDPEFERVARGTLDYVLRDLALPGGGFATGQDADSIVAGKTGPELVEGVFYDWSVDEVVRLLGRKAADVVLFHYGIDAKNRLPFVAHSEAATRAKFGLTQEELVNLLTNARATLNDVRETRPRPAWDDKVLTGWNALAISALGRAGGAFNEPRYRNAALTNARFLVAKMWDAKSKTLRRRYRNGSAGIEALPEDYALLVQGLLDAYEASFDIKLLQAAFTIQQRFDELFWRQSETRYAQAAGPLGEIVTETDAPIPTANSVAALNLIRLGEMTDNDVWRTRASLIAKSFSSRLVHSPTELPQLVSAMLVASSTPKQIVIAGHPTSEETRALLDLVNRRFIPNRVLLLADAKEGQAQLAQWLPFIADMKRIGNKPTAYVCEHYACKLPTSDPAQVEKLLE